MSPFKFSPLHLALLWLNFHLQNLKWLWIPLLLGTSNLQLGIYSHVSPMAVRDGSFLGQPQKGSGSLLVASNKYFTCLFIDNILLCSPGWPQTYDPSASTSWVLGLQTWNTTPSSFYFLENVLDEQKFLILMKSNLVTFYFVASVFVPYLRIQYKDIYKLNRCYISIYLCLL
jgi:hypothetical protein